jgi:hypothetical protein
MRRKPQLERRLAGDLTLALEMAFLLVVAATQHGGALRRDEAFDLARKTW